MRYLLMFSLLFLAVACDSAKQQQDDSYGDQLGTVQVPASCGQQAHRQIERGIALVHHMTYEGARAAFETASQIDSNCAMAYWGQAMSFIHPLWSDPPSEANFKKGQALLVKARARAKDNDRVAAYITAAEAYYAAGWNLNETSNLASFARAWQEVSQRYPGDLEAASFYALAHMATADPADKTFAKQKEAGAIVEKILAQIPDHPGAHHYIVHAYDYPPLADRALEVARSYGKIAPEIPHALHMPTHIFTRLGYWQESIDMNLRSAAAALKHPAGDLLSLHYLHALDYLAYAHLQRADDTKAQEVLDLVENLEGSIQPHVASAYTLAAVPARVALERQMWAEAAMLEPRAPANYLWDKVPAMEAITHFARGLGAARSGDSQVVSGALDRLTALREQSAETSNYWAKQIEIQRLSVKAWQMYADGKHGEALDVMRNAAELEASTERNILSLRVKSCRLRSCSATCFLHWVIIQKPGRSTMQLWFVVPTDLTVFMAPAALRNWVEIRAKRRFTMAS